jgi:hypothetical protein
VANDFDQFDAPQAAPNDFDQFDAPKAVTPPPRAPQAYSAGPITAAMGTPDPVTQYVHSAVSGMGQSIGATNSMLGNLVHGRIGSISQADAAVQQYNSTHPAYQPETQGGQDLSAFMGSNWNPLNLVGVATKYAGKGITALADQWGVPGQYSTIAGPAGEAIGNVAIGAYGGVKALGLGAPEAAGAPSAAGATSGPLAARAAATAPGARIEPTLEPVAPRAPYFEPKDIPGTNLTVDNEPVEGGLPPAVSAERAQILQRVGHINARESALSGDAGAAATDFQLSKFDEPAGQAAKAQFDAERQTQVNHAQGIVKATGGTLGTDEESLNNRGQTIAAPFDALQNYFDQQKQAAYDAADARAEGKPVGQMEGTQALLKDPDFTETLLAKDQGGLLSSIQRQFGRFQGLNPDGFTVANAENFRKWLNQVWTPNNSHTLGQVKGALDDDVLKGAGEDIYGPARAIVQMEKQTYSPSGVAKLMDVDPQSPLNRATPFNKIPDTLTRLAPDQFTNVIKTLQSMPDEIQPQAQAALSEIKAQLANKILDAGSSTQGQWSAPKVSEIVKANSAKLQSAFADTPQILGQIEDLDSAGKILKVNQGYPGAAAQASNALERGLMSRTLPKFGAAAGAGAGSYLGPLGSIGGAALGEAAGKRWGASMAEKASLKSWDARISPLSDWLQQRAGQTK